jgi:putative methanogenesis marker protein 8
MLGHRTDYKIGTYQTLMTGKGGRHVFDALGMTRVIIIDGEVVEVGEPEIQYCPLFKKLVGMEDITPEKIRQNMEFRIKDFGFCTENRIVRAKDYVTFGVSEILSSALERGDLDAAVIAADGCGTAIITEPALLQGMCGRISGLVETSPLQVVLDAVGRDNVLDPETVPLDMIKGAELADSKGYGRFAVTVASGEDAETLRRRYGGRVLIVGVHTSHVSCDGAKKMFDNCDIITACASGRIRAEAERRDVLIAGNKIQMYGVTDIGAKLVSDKLASIGKHPYNGEPKDEPRPLIFMD